ncbi:MAG TPA: polyphosphate kinase 1, partial [Gemmatimonadaceae bacterium]
PPTPPSLLFNREISWLEFNARVLHEAEDERTPLLERLKFLAIYSTNLDEFYMVRVAALRRQVAAGVHQAPPDGLSPQQQLEEIDRRVRVQLDRQRRCLDDTLPALDAAGVRLVTMDDITTDERTVLDAYFEAEVFPVLTPLAVDPGHPFPYISNLSLSLAVQVRDDARHDEHFARVKVPRSLPRWVPVGRPHTFVPLENLIGAHLARLFPGMRVLGWHMFRITRNSDLELSAADEPEDLLAMIEEQIFQRRFGEVVRLEVQTGMPPQIQSLLLAELREATDPTVATLTERDVFEGGQLLELGDLLALAALEIPDFRDPPFAPVTPPEVRDKERSIFDIIRERDLLVHHPFESFGTTVEKFFDTAAEDDSVLAIKLTLYRTSGDTAIVRALSEAAQRGKQVAVLVELQARFDEVNNINWARTLESYGVHVAYGLPGLKTHAKTALVVRREADGIRRYVHIGTGNYNSRTARLYTDFGLLTCHPQIGADVSEVFNLLTGFSRQREYRQLFVAPATMADRFLQLIGREADHARAGRPARIIAKMNALQSPAVIHALYDASQAGVDIDLIVRGTCCLRPGIPGVSERIRVVSIVGRFLEHSRLYYFQNGGQNEYFIGSADWMPRNLERRVEVITPILDDGLHHRLSSLLEVYLADERQGWDLGPDGTYTQRTPLTDDDIGSHRVLQRDPWGLDRTESRYITQDFRAAALAPAPEPHDHSRVPANGRRRKSKRNGGLA